MGSPLVSESPDAILLPSDLVVACIVMSGRTLEECLQPPTRMDVLRSWLLHRSKEYFDYTVAGIRTHLEEGASYPKFFDKKDQQKGGSPRGLDWRGLLLGTLVKHGSSVEEVMTMPEAQAVWLYTAIAITEGTEIDILPTDLEELLDQS